MVTVFCEDVFCSLLRVALGLSRDFPYNPTEQEWNSLFTLAKQQTVLSLFYEAFSNLPEPCRPPRQLLLRYAAFVESVHGLNRLMNLEAARYTRMFEERGVQSVILKGQANARLYPNPLSRQAGDIDIWIPGGFVEVERLLLDMGLISKKESTKDIFHHIAFRNEHGIEIEVHHRLASGIPFRNHLFSKCLMTEIENSALVPEGFYSPSIRFALLMQLSHLQQHFFCGGFGFRHITDYFMLLVHSSQEDREYVWKRIEYFHLGRFCAAVMWVLEKAFLLPQEYMLCQPNKRYGIFLYRGIMTGGNFGRNNPRKTIRVSVLNRWFHDRMDVLCRFSYDPLNVILNELNYWKKTFSLIPERVRRRNITLSKRSRN